MSAMGRFRTFTNGCLRPEPDAQGVTIRHPRMEASSGHRFCVAKFHDNEDRGPLNSWES
jgi:hypothetical protein